MKGPGARVVVALALALILLCVGSPASPAPVSAPPHQAESRSQEVPVYAYFYQWFNHESWRRAKTDYPLSGRYSSDDPKILHDQIDQAQAAGLNGFLTSWKYTARLNRRLEMLLGAAQDRGFDIGVVYEALDFDRRPLPIATVRWDMVELVKRWGDELRSQYFARPVIVWTGIDDYSLADVRSVRRALGTSAYLLASSKSAQKYQRVAGLVDGDAYYWSSANPGTSYTRQRLTAIASAVHHDHGIWLAPATAGFDGRSLGHQRVVPRDGGRTLTRSLDDALTSQPDAIGVISWNEWSENTYIEPGERYGRQELDALTAFLDQHGLRSRGDPVSTASKTNSLSDPTWRGLGATVGLRLGTLLAAGVLSRRARRRDHQQRE
jgi:hypothetical protein